MEGFDGYFSDNILIAVLGRDKTVIQPMVGAVQKTEL
jgi:hypothetical protein